MKQATRSTKKNDIQRRWYLFDCKDRILGKVAVEIAHALMGKSKPYFVRHLDCGDFVVCVNAKLVAVSGRKETDKLYGKYSGYPAGLKQKSLWQIRKEKPTQLIRHAVMGMLPKNKLRDTLMTRLYIYSDSEHPHTSKFAKS